MIWSLFIATRVITCFMSDTQNTYNLNSVSRSTLVCQVPISCHQNSPWHLTGRNQLRCFLKLKKLLINKFTFIGIHLITQYPAFLSIGRNQWCIFTILRRHHSCKTCFWLNNFFMSTVDAPPTANSSSDGCFTCGCNNSRNANNLSDELTLKVSEHQWIFIWMKLNLKFRARHSKGIDFF